MADEILAFIREQQSSSGAAEKFAVIDERNRDREIEEFIREQKTSFRGMGNLARGVGQSGVGDVPASLISAGGMVADAASQLGPTQDPGVLSRRQAARGLAGTRSRGGREVVMDELPETPEKFWEIMRDPNTPTREIPAVDTAQTPTPLTKAAVKIAEQWRREVAERMPYERSTGPVAGFVEDTLRSAPTTAAGAGVGLGVGALTRNPAAGLSAGSIFMALADASGEMEEVYAEGVAEGLSEAEAVRRANAVGAIYAPASALLERVGLGKILQIGKNVPGKSRLVQAAKRVVEAGATEFITEAAQTAAAEVVQGVVTDDWQGVKELAASDELFRAGLSGALLGGGIRGGVEALNPANYRSGKAFLADAEAAAGAEADVQGAPKGASKVAQGALRAQTGLGDPESATSGTPDAAQTGPDEAGRTQTEPDPVQAGVTRLLAANQVEGRALGDEELSEPQRAVSARLAERGIRVAFVDGGKPLTMAAANTAPGVVVMDARIEDDKALQELQWHEAVHDLERREPGIWKGLVEDLEAVAPGVMEAGRQRYAALWAGAGQGEIDAARLASEAPSNAAELVVGAIMAEEQSPGTIGRLLRASPPSVRTKLIGALQALLRKVGLYRQATALERARADLDKATDLGGPEALRAAAVVMEAVGQLRAFMPEAAPAPSSASVADTQPQNPRSEAVEAGSVSASRPEREARAVVRDRRGSEFTNRVIRRRLGEIVQASPRTEQEYQDEFVDGGEQYGTDLTFSFSGPLPTEIRQALQGEKANIRMLFKGNVPGAQGADVMGSIGADAMVERARRMIQGRDSRVEEIIDIEGALDALSPDGGMLGTIRRLRGSLPASEIVPYEVVDNPAVLPEGATFRIQDAEFVVSRGDQGTRAVSMDDPRQGFNLDGVESMPVDRRSLNRNAGAAVPEVDVLDEIPFAIRDALTPFDTEGIVQTRAKAAAIASTHTIDTPARKRLRRRIARQLYGDGASVKNREAVLILGPPAAGKSSAVANPVVRLTGGLIVDSDMAKELLPEFDKGVGAGAVHLESDAIASLILERAVEAGDNLVLPRVGKGLRSMESLRDSLVAAGYRVHLIDLRLDPAKAAQRAVSRFEQTGRFVDPDYVVNHVGNKPTAVYDALKKGGGFESYSAYSNDVQFGEKPIVLEREGPAPEVPAQNRLVEPGGSGGSDLRGGGETGRGEGQSPELTPFAIRPEPRGPVARDLTGRPIFEPATGRQQTLPLETESPIAREDRERRERQARENGDDPGQTTMFAVQPDPDLPGMTPAQTRITPEARPDLANPGRTDEVRGFVNAVDQIRNAAGQPEATTFDAIEQRAAAMLARDPRGVESRVRDRVQRGEALTAEETVILSQAVSRQTQGALRTENAADFTEAVKTTWQYRQSGTIAARALGIRRDRVAGPGQRYREAMMNAMLLPSPKVRAKLERIAQKLADPDLADTTRKALEDRQQSLFDREGKKIKTIREDLAKQGIDPRVINEITMRDPTFAATVTDIARRARTDFVDDLYWVWMNSILSGPLTHSANLIGNFTNLVWRYGVLRGIEAQINTGTGGRVGDATATEYAYMMGKVWQSASAGWQAMTQAWATNRQVFDEQITGEEMALFDSVKGESVYLERSGPRNRIARLAGLNGLPLKLLTVEDQFFKAFAGNLQAQALAYRQAKSEGLDGEAVAERVEALLEDWKHPIWRESLEEAKAAVFQDDPSVLGEAAMDLRRRIPGMKFLIPFIKTPDRLFVRGIEASPVGFFTGLFDVGMGLKNKDATRTARGASTAILAAGMLFAIAALREDDEGFPIITGSRTPNWRDSDEQYRTAPPMSIRIGGQWYSYARIEPLSTGLALTVDMLDRMEGGDNLFEGMAGSWKSLLAVAEDKTFLRSIGEVLEAVRNPERSGNLLTELGRRTFVTAWVPNLFKQAARAFDPTMRDTRPPGDAGWWDTQAAKLPYEAMPMAAWGEVPRHDLWGRPIQRGSPWGSEGLLAGLYRLAVPINVSDAEWHPMDRLVFNYNRRVRDGQLGDTTDEDGHDASTGEFHPRPPGRSFVDRGETLELTAEEYQSMIRNAGQRASERLLGMTMNVDEPGKADVRRIRRVFREEYDREKQRIARERRGR